MFKLCKTRLQHKTESVIQIEATKLANQQNKSNEALHNQNWLPRESFTFLTLSVLPSDGARSVAPYIKIYGKDHEYIQL